MTLFGWNLDQWEKAGGYYNRLNPGGVRAINAESFIDVVSSVGFERPPALDDYLQVRMFWLSRRNDQPNEVKILLPD